MTKLEEKLIELGYKKHIYYFYSKQNIRVYINNKRNKILKENCCVLLERIEIKNRNDIQKLHDDIEYYHEQLMMMYDDLKELELCQD